MPSSANLDLLPSILVIDDEQHIRDILCKQLTQVGYRVHTAGNGLHARQILFGGDKRIDLVLCDMRMPGCDGLQLFAQVQEKKMQIPFILLTGYILPEFLARAKKHGIEEIIQKPVRRGQILEAVRRHVA